MSVDQSLPPALAERLRWLVSPADAQHQPGEFVLYWMHSAMRGHENPALDVAICLARQNGLPLLVYHALSEDYPYSSDRFHAFILQGQRDVQRELADRGIESHFHLARDGDRGPHLRDLTRRAAVLVTEDMPVHPLVGWPSSAVRAGGPRGGRGAGRLRVRVPRRRRKGGRLSREVSFVRAARLQKETLAGTSSC